MAHTRHMLSAFLGVKMYTNNLVPGCDRSHCAIFPQCARPKRRAAEASRLLHEGVGRRALCTVAPLVVQ